MLSSRAFGLDAVQGRAGGYTVFEVMIVLAVTGVLFFSAVAVFAGRRQKTEFSQSVYDLQSQIQSYANEVSSGTFPGTAGYKCTASAPPNPRPTLTSASQEQSTSQDCLYIGRVIQAVPGSEALYVYSILGLRTARDASGYDTGDPATTLASALPEVAMTSDQRNYLFMDTYRLLPGVRIVSAKYYSSEGAASDAELLQLYSTFQSESGSQGMSAYTIPGLNSIPEPSGTSVNANFKSCIELQSPCNAPTVVSGFGWKLCLADSNLSSQRAELTIRSATAGIITRLDMAGCST